MELVYTGVGSRSTPSDILNIMMDLATEAAKAGYTLRSGAAAGADAAFEAGCDIVNGNKHIYIPWPNFNGSKSDRLPKKEAFDIAAKVHPAWHNCSDAAEKLHARNIHQILGDSLNSPSQFVACWTKNGKTRGGTATAIRLAKQYNVPVFNLGDDIIKDEIKTKGLWYILDSIIFNTFIDIIC